MTDRLPSIPPRDEMIDRVAREVAAQIVAHIEWAYPAALDAVPRQSFARSAQRVARNVMAEVAQAAETGRWEECVRELRARRLRSSAFARAMRAAVDPGQ